MNNSGKTLGILGGLGPMSSVYFYEMLTEHTLAERDSDHLNILLSSRADTPDRTEFITGRSDRNPIYTMMSEVSKLIGAGADIIAIPCNTAHYFLPRLQEQTQIPFISILESTAKACAKTFPGKTACVLATRGTLASGLYNRALEAEGVSCILPNEEQRDVLMYAIYGPYAHTALPTHPEVHTSAPTCPVTARHR